LAELFISPEAEEDLQRLVAFLESEGPAAAAEVVPLVDSALRILRDHPLVGRPVGESLHELTISRGRTGYVAIYHYSEADDTVAILAIRHQREAGYND
jgi:plasmid stabilization system protein ParE